VLELAELYEVINTDKILCKCVCLPTENGMQVTTYPAFVINYHNNLTLMEITGGIMEIKIELLGWAWRMKITLKMVGKRSLKTWVDVVRDGL
jgi:hypothetical protein